MKKLHIKDCKYNSSSRDFVGIILVALLQGKPMNIEKLMNLIYLVDYKSVNISGSPITMLDFYVHESGPVKKYDALKFSQYELEVIAKVLEEFGDKSLTELQEITKGEGSLYHDVFKLNNLKLYFELTEDLCSGYKISFIPLLNTPLKKELFSMAYSTHDFLSQF